MANFMGPMAPPQAAPGQPPQLDIRTNPNQRQRFRNFMRQNTRPAGMTGVPPMYPASQTPFPAAPMPPMAMPAPAPIMPMQMAQPMRPPMQQPMGPARNVDIFSPQYMQAQPPVGMEDGGDVPMPAVMPNSKQKDVMLRIAYDEARRKGAVENALRQLETDRVIERSKEMELDRIRDIDRQDLLNDVKRMRLESELADRNYRLKGLLTPPDQGLEDDPVFALPIKREDGGSVPPRRTVIKGQPHMLSYINAEEAGILKALGGSGEPGPMGIPSYAPGGEKGLGGGSSGSSGSGSGSDKSGNDDRGGYGMSPGRSQAQFGTSEFAGMSEQDAKDSLAGGGGSDQAQAVQAALAAQAAATNVQRDIAANAAQSRPQVNLTTVENPQQTQDILDVFASSTTPSTVDPTVTNAVASTYSATAGDTLKSISDLLGLENDLLADSKPMTDRQALAQSAPAVDVTSTAAKAPDVLGMGDEYDNGIPDYNDPNRPGYKGGLPTGLEFADTRRGRFTTNLAGLTEEQRAAMPGYMSPKGKEGIAAGIMNTLDIDPTRDVYGYELDDTGRVTGMVGPSQMPGMITAAVDLLGNVFGTPPETTEDLLNAGVYTGFGAGSMPQGGGGGGSDPIIYPPLAPEVVPQDPVSNVMGGMGSSYVAPPSLPSPLVPSDRAYTPTNLPMPVGYGAVPTGAINPLAYLTSGFPVGTQFFADGGQVLDQAAGRFLEALTAA